MKLFLNGKIIDEKNAKVSVFDRGFMYGDGIYETILARNGSIFRPKEHLERLFESAERIYLRLPYSKKQFIAVIEKLLKTNKLNSSRIKIMISRGESSPGYFEHGFHKPTVVVSSAKFNGWPKTIYDRGVKIALSKIRRNHILSLDPAIKSCNCLNQVMAAKGSAKSGAFEALMLNLDGYVAEGTISNIFIIKNSILLTPHMRTGILGGVTRSAVLQIAKANGITCLESFIKPAEVFDADECFITSTTLEIVPVIKVGARKIGSGVPGPITRKLGSILNDTIDKETKR